MSPPTSPPLGAAEGATLVETRRDLHRHPELAFAEERTAGRVVERLEAAGYAPRAGVAGTGVVAAVAGAAPGPTVLLRADMDALPVDEENEVPYRSTRPGRMHACGHDGHTAILLAVADRLRADPPPAGEVVLCFQPAEEGAGGAARMIEEGVLEGVDAAFGLHLWNELEVGQVALAAGPVLAAVDRFEVEIAGAGGHGAIPQRARDPVVAACHVVTALQTVVSRQTDPLDACVVTVGSIRAGDSFNVIPRTARLSGTCRSFARERHARLPEEFTRVVEGVAGGLGCEATVRYERTCPPTVNEPGCTELARAVAGGVLGAAAVRTEGAAVRAAIGEDFAYFLEAVPGCFLLVGSRNPERGLVHPHHSPRFDFDEDALGHGVRLLEGIARAHLARGEGGA